MSWRYALLARYWWQARVARRNRQPMVLRATQLWSRQKTAIGHPTRPPANGVASIDFRSPASKIRMMMAPPRLSQQVTWRARAQRHRPHPWMGCAGHSRPSFCSALCNNHQGQAVSTRKEEGDRCAAWSTRLLPRPQAKGNHVLLLPGTTVPA